MDNSCEKGLNRLLNGHNFLDRFFTGTTGNLYDWQTFRDVEGRAGGDPGEGAGGGGLVAEVNDAAAALSAGVNIWERRG